MIKPMTKSSIESIQKHLLSSPIDWFSGLQVERECKMFKTSPTSGLSLISGGFDMNPKDHTDFFIWCAFSDAEGHYRNIKFAPFWIPEDCKQTGQQCYMHFNELLGINAWTGLPGIKRDREHMVFTGRLPEVD